MLQLGFGRIVTKNTSLLTTGGEMSPLPGHERCPVFIRA